MIGRNSWVVIIDDRLCFWNLQNLYMKANCQTPGFSGDHTHCSLRLRINHIHNHNERRLPSASSEAEPPDNLDLLFSLHPRNWAEVGVKNRSPVGLLAHPKFFFSYVGRVSEEILIEKKKEKEK